MGQFWEQVWRKGRDGQSPVRGHSLPGAGLALRRLALALVLGVALGLGGCLRYDLGIEFKTPHQGVLVQHIQWAQGGDALGTAWQGALRERVQQVGGSLRLQEGQGLEIRVPFANARDLAQRFNQFFGSDGGEPLRLPGNLPVTAHLDWQQGNWLLAIYTRLSLSLDLTALPDSQTFGPPRLQGVPWFTGQVNLSTPWGWHPVGQKGESGSPLALVPGQVNTFTAEFWLPSPIGVGALGIAAAIALGYRLKYPPAPRPPR